MIDGIFFWLLDLVQDFRRVRFRSHMAFFPNNPIPHIFLTITNLSRSREIEVTHVWLDTHPPVSAMNKERPLPIRLVADQIWETWIPVSNIPAQELSNVLNLGRIYLSNGRTIKSRPDHSVPPEGFVPGNDISGK